MTTLFHLTWDCHVASILRMGLIPNHSPNQWVMDAANKRSKRATFLCVRGRMDNWDSIFGGGWVTPPAEGAKRVWLKVRVPKAWLTPDKAVGEYYDGDFKCRRVIPAANISRLSSQLAA